MGLDCDPSLYAASSEVLPLIFVRITWVGFGLIIVLDGCWTE